MYEQNLKTTAQVCDTRQVLDEIATEIREVYAWMLDSALGTQSTQGTCLYACLLLVQAINQFTPLEAVVQGGDGVLDGGYTDSGGQRHGHYWVAVPQSNSASNDSSWVVDITADQFGGPAVQVLNGTEVAGQYEPGDQATVDGHVAELGLPTLAEHGASHPSG